MTALAMSNPTSDAHKQITHPAQAALPRNRAVSLLLRLESAVMLALSAGAYHWLGGSWLMFGLLFLLPDLAMLGYLRGPRLGATVYNAAHTYLAPTLVAAAGWAAAEPFAFQLAAIWAGHIAFDRLAGYGLKYASGFNDTHLGQIGHRS